jgi:hypothetical protein
MHENAPQIKNEKKGRMSPIGEHLVYLYQMELPEGNRIDLSAFFMDNFHWVIYILVFKQKGG